MSPLYDVVRLANEHRFKEAAEVSLKLAEEMRQNNLRQPYIGNLTTAAKLFHLAGDSPRALELYERVFELEQQQLQFLPAPDLVKARLSSSPESFSRATMAALDGGHWERAIELAETGRFRLIGQIIGPNAQAPAGVSAETWRGYVNAWRRLAADSANDLVASDHEVARQRAGEALRSLEVFRKALRKEGARAEQLHPPIPTFKADGVVERVSSGTRVLYSVVLHETVRFIAFGCGPAGEVPFAQTAQQQLLSAVRYFRPVLATAKTPIELDRGVRELLVAINEPIRTLLATTLSGTSATRLLWIPHGPLSAVPLAACSHDDGVLLDCLAVMTAPSLAYGLRPPVHANRHSARALCGSADERTLTTGAGVVARVFDPTAPTERELRSIDDLAAAAAEASLVVLNAHGVYDWKDPLCSALALAGGANCRLTLAELIDHIRLPSDTLILLGACDAGTISQSENNEAIGIPTALLLGGASTVLGAQWPVKRPAAVALSISVARALAEGVPSPEAVAIAARYLRRSDWSTVAHDLELAEHPIARPLAEGANAGLPPVSPHDWGGFVHWGAAWETTIRPS